MATAGERPRSAKRKQLEVGDGQGVGELATPGAKPKSATVEEPDSDIPDGTRLVKGRSMPSLR